MKQSGLVLLCARNARSSAYVQALAHAGIEPMAVIIFGEGAAQISTNRTLQSNDCSDEIFCPDVTIPVQSLVNRLGWRCCLCSSRELNSDELLSLLENLAPVLLVYSGYGGQLVPESILEKVQVLHIHSGALPQYRGSTTIYYEIIEHAGCAASAILLDKQIDTGPIVRVRHYPLPPAGIDVDYLYDNQIRADLLIDVLKFRQSEGCLPAPIEQSDEMPPYFIIHPVLKHLALLYVDSGE